MKYDIVTIGDAFEDVFVFPTGLKIKQDRAFTTGYGASFELGEKIPLREVEYEVGGSACNTSIGFKRLGLDCSIVTIVGDDTPAEKIFKRFDQENVDVSNIKVDRKMKTNFSTIFSLPEGRTIFVYHGLRDYKGLRIKKSVNSKWYFLAPLGEGTEELEKDLVSKVSEENSLLAWNPGTLQIKKGASRFRNILKNTSALFLNREEAIKLVDYPIKPSEVEVMRKLHSLGPKLVFVTNGKEGAKAFDGKTFYSIGGIENTKRVDATGAGDSFAVGVLSKLIKCQWNGEQNEECIKEALKWGILNATSVLGYVGAQKGLLNQTQIEKELEFNKRLEVRTS